MFHLFTRAAPSLKSAFVRPSTNLVARAMATSKATNDQLKNSKLFDVSHVTAVVTGGGTGIGLMISQALVANGAKVYITGRRKEALDTVVEQYNTGPGQIIACVLYRLLVPF